MSDQTEQARTITVDCWSCGDDIMVPVRAHPKPFEQWDVILADDCEACPHCGETDASPSAEWADGFEEWLRWAVNVEAAVEYNGKAWRKRDDADLRNIHDAGKCTSMTDPCPMCGRSVQDMAAGE